MAAAQEAEAAKPKPPMRLASLDAYRGFVMFLMAAELLELPKVAAHFPDHHWWQMIARHSEHVAWTGCSLHDLIQPSFSFMVGVALRSRSPAGRPAAIRPPGSGRTRSGAHLSLFC